MAYQRFQEVTETLRDSVPFFAPYAGLFILTFQRLSSALARLPRWKEGKSRNLSYFHALEGAGLTLDCHFLYPGIVCLCVVCTT